MNLEGNAFVLKFQHLVVVAVEVVVVVVVGWADFQDVVGVAKEEVSLEV